MCGLFGFASNRPTNVLFDLLTELAIATEQRGPHATGVCYFRQKKLRVQKAPVTARKFVEHHQWERLRGRLPWRFIGHTRKATKGDPKINKNNHPFVGEHFALAHNGTLKKYEYEAWAPFCESDCDSEAILRVMDLHPDPVLATSRAMSAFYDSSFAVMFFEKGNRRLHFFRNTGRPLRVWRTENLILIGSTEPIMQEAFIAAGGRKLPTDVDQWTPVPGKLYTIKEDLEISSESIFDFSDKKDPGFLASKGQTPAKAVRTKAVQYGSTYHPSQKLYGVDNRGNVVTWSDLDKGGK